MDLGLKDIVALVVDSHLPIAKAAAVSLAKEGAILSLTAPDNYNMRHVELELARLDIPQGRFRAVIANLDREQDIHRLVRETLHRESNIGVLVNIFRELPPAPATTLVEENITPALASNFTSAVRLTREVLPHMKRLGMGRVINLVPYSAIEASYCGTLSSLSLAPLLAYTKGLAYELAPQNITVNNVIYAGVDCPGADAESESESDAEGRETEGNGAAVHDGDATEAASPRNGGDAVAPMRRLAAPHEIGDVVAMIASARASYLTGANVIMDGGQHRHYYA